MPKQYTPPSRRFSDALLQLARADSIAKVFDDFLDFALLSCKWWDRKPVDFEAHEKKYQQPQHAHLMMDAFLAMGDIADANGNGFKDPFADFFGEHLASTRTGQFFTPESLCDLTAHAVIPADVADGATVYDPACGSGGLLLAAARINRKLVFYGTDIDLTCCKMAILNFFLNSLKGEISWGNTLSGKIWRTWKTDRVLAGDGHYLPYYVQLEPQDGPATTVANEKAAQQHSNPPVITTGRQRRTEPKHQLSFKFGDNNK